MDLEELDATFARLGLPSTREQLHERRQWIVREPWRLGQDVDRGDPDYVDFAGEDELCRHLLSRALVHGRIDPARLPEADAGRPAGTRHARPAAPNPGAGGAPTLRWELPLAPFTRVSARGAGLVLLEDTSALHARPAGHAPAHRAQRRAWAGALVGPRRARRAHPGRGRRRGPDLVAR